MKTITQANILVCNQHIFFQLFTCPMIFNWCPHQRNVLSYFHSLTLPPLFHSYLFEENHKDKSLVNWFLSLLHKDSLWFTQECRIHQFTHKSNLAIDPAFNRGKIVCELHRLPIGCNIAWEEEEGKSAAFLQSCLFTVLHRGLCHILQMRIRFLNSPFL